MTRAQVSYRGPPCVRARAASCARSWPPSRGRAPTCGRRRPSRSGTPCPPAGTPRWRRRRTHGPARRRSSRRARPACDAALGEREEPPGVPCSSAVGDPPEPALVDAGQHELAAHRERLERRQRPPRRVARRHARRRQREPRRRGARGRRRADEDRRQEAAGCAPTRARPWTPAGRPCRSRGRCRATAAPAPSARAARGRPSRSAATAPPIRFEKALRHHAPIDIAERGLKIRSMCRKRSGRPRSSTSSGAPGPIGADRRPCARRAADRWSPATSHASADEGRAGGDPAEPEVDAAPPRSTPPGG